MVFSEPLDVNPVGRIFRALTPQMRTVDERPLRSGELATCAAMFDMVFHYGELFSVPAGLVSRYLFSHPANPLTKLAFHCDEGLKKLIPAIGPLYRHVVMIGEKRTGPI